MFDAISKIKVQADIDKKIHEATVQINSYQTKLNDNLEQLMLQNINDQASDLTIEISKIAK